MTDSGPGAARPADALRLATLLKEAIESAELNFPNFTYENTAKWLIERGVRVGARPTTGEEP